MSTKASKERAVEVLRQLTAEHKDADYFKRAEVGACDGGWGIDFFVERDRWKAAKAALEFPSTLVPSRVEEVPITVFLVG